MVKPPAVPPKAADASIREFYELTRSAVDGHRDMKDAVRKGLTAQYHRVVRERPESKYVPALVSVRRQLKELAAERRRSTHPLHVEQIDLAMNAIAQGTLLWVNEKLGRGAASDTGTVQPSTGVGDI